MRIGIPKEIKDNETRIALVPSSVKILCESGNKVLIQKDTGIASGFTNEQYEECGAEIALSIEQVYETCDMIVKVKEPQPREYNLLQEGQILFGFLHLATESDLTRILLSKKINAIGAETIEKMDGSLPVLKPMSEIAGKCAIIVGGQLLQSNNGEGKGVLLSSIAGIGTAKVVIIGAGNVGISAGKLAVGLGNDVTLIDNDLDKLRRVENIFGNNVRTLFSTPYNIANVVREADLVISSILINDNSSSKIVTEQMVRSMKDKSVIIDISIDQGGSVETVDRVTSLESPTFSRYGIVHYSVDNIASCVPRTSSIALNNAILPYIIDLANEGFIEAVKKYYELQKGVNTCCGKLTNENIATALDLQSCELSSIIGF